MCRLFSIFISLFTCIFLQFTHLHFFLKSTGYRTRLEPSAQRMCRLHLFLMHIFFYLNMHRVSHRLGSSAQWKRRLRFFFDWRTSIFFDTISYLFLLNLHACIYLFKLRYFCKGYRSRSEPSAQWISRLCFFTHISIIFVQRPFCFCTELDTLIELSAQWMSRLYFLFLIYTYFFFHIHLVSAQSIARGQSCGWVVSAWFVDLHTSFFFPNIHFFFPRRVSHAARAVGTVDESSAFSRAKFHGALFWNYFAFRCAEVGLFYRFFFPCIYMSLLTFTTDESSGFLHSTYCSVLQSVAECCSVLQTLEVVQCVAVCCSVVQCVVVCCSVLQCVVRCCSLMQCDAVCCSVLQCVCAVCCSV